MEGSTFMRTLFLLPAALACACAAPKTPAPATQTPAAPQVEGPAESASEPDAVAEDDGPPATLAKPGPKAKPGPIPGAEDYPDYESLPEQPEDTWSVLLAGDAAPIIGVVLDKDGKPWSGLQVVLGPECGEAMVAFTNDDGRLEARGFPRCKTDVFVSFEDARAEVSVTPGEKRVDVKLTPACKSDAEECPERAAKK